MNEQVNLDRVYHAFAAIIVATIFIIWISEHGGLWINGISHVANDTEDYHNNAYPVEGEYTVEIDLRDLESNEGRVLFDDGANQIYVSKVIQNDSHYEVGFRSSGTFNTGGATLVSAVEHAHNRQGFTDIFRAEAQASYRGEDYELFQSGSSGLNYRDGDEFGIHLPSPDEGIDIDLEKEPMIEITITNLYINIWAEASGFK
ncbi:hypothetical protein SAMN05216389_101370 [Oceanobacillus limi]|uniref:Uncharacterized protein n=1 Tax=Oceanobacillus limi TaxID=930131 RepID=A0A1H9YFB3_9BACI|nr:hypothetical protein [Oceanobacillus limi]SES67703.1 hypothetical protein SAMN05216389_101370 [Oceanobacillus limi]